MNEADIQLVLMRRAMYSKQHRVVVPNSTSLFYHEADLLSVTKAGLVHEYEIKCTRSDYTRDFWSKKNKHWFLEHPDRMPGRIPNYFWFVTLEFDVEPPSYAGWMLLEPVPEDHYWSDASHNLKVQKRAPRLHGQKWGDAQVAKVARLLSFRLLKLAQSNGHAE